MKTNIRPICVEGKVAYVPLTQGKVAVIDALDAETVSEYNWHAKQNGKRLYAFARTVGPSGKVHDIQMHRLLMGEPDNMDIDHVDGDGLNNRRNNLRLATKSENGRNRGANVTNTSGFKGVSWHKAAGRWLAQITVKRKNKYLGLYNTPEEAHAAYCDASKKYHGEFGRSE